MNSQNVSRLEKYKEKILYLNANDLGSYFLNNSAIFWSYIENQRKKLLSV